METKIKLTGIKGLKKFICISGLAVVGLFFNACEVGYVDTEPTYGDEVRPAPSSDVDVWIDGDWYWDGGGHRYVHHPGHWERPRQGRTYVTGHWESSPRGKYWVRGRYQRERGQRERR